MRRQVNIVQDGIQQDGFLQQDKLLCASPRLSKQADFHARVHVNSNLAVLAIHVISKFETEISGARDRIEGCWWCFGKA